jgi:hypothetical protein
MPKRSGVARPDRVRAAEGDRRDVSFSVVCAASIIWRSPVTRVAACVLQTMGLHCSALKERGLAGEARRHFGP